MGKSGGYAGLILSGEKFPGVVRDLSTNGAFISGEPLPLLSRVAFTFPLEGFGQVEVLAAKARSSSA